MNMFLIGILIGLFVGSLMTWVIVMSSIKLAIKESEKSHKRMIEDIDRNDPANRWKYGLEDQDEI